MLSLKNVVKYFGCNKLETKYVSIKKPQINTFLEKYRSKKAPNNYVDICFIVELNILLGDVYSASQEFFASF